MLNDALVVFYNCRDIRSKDVSKIHLQLCLALLMMYLLFVAGIDQTSNAILCTTISLLIQYFALASVLWMGAEAIIMIKKLVIVFGKISSTFLVILSLCCWSKLPLQSKLIVWTYSVLCCSYTNDFSCNWIDIDAIIEEEFHDYYWSRKHAVIVSNNQLVIRQFCLGTGLLRHSAGLMYAWMYVLCTSQNMRAHHVDGFNNTWLV